MKQQLLLLLICIFAFGANAQTIPYVPISQINYVSPSDLSACKDSSAYEGDTIKTRGVVVTAGNLSEVPSSSVTGGVRPFIHIVDTVGGGAMEPWRGIEVMGVYTDAQGALQVPAGFFATLPGDVVEITGIVSEYNSGKQISLLDNNSFSIVSSASAPTSKVVLASDLNDQNRVNKLTTGEQWEGVYAKLENVTVSEVVFFSGGSRVSFNVVDAQGNKVNVSDRFLAQKLPSYQTVNPLSPQTTGSFVPPVPGTFYNSISGMIRHDGNGCTNSGGQRGYEINPFDSAHYDLGFAPPFISEVERDPKTPTSTQSVDVSFTITDFDGTVDTVRFYWSDNDQTPSSQFTGTIVTPISGSTDEYEFTIPSKPDDTLVRYYIEAIDDEGNASYYPNTPVNQTDPNVDYYFVRDNGLKIFDLQFTFNPDGISPYVGEEVTVTGIVTASARAYDLGYVYIQDEGGSEWSGIWLTGFGISNFYRDEEVTVTGTVEENFGMTRLVVSQANKTGNRNTIAPTAIDPSDSASYAESGWEKWEGVLVKYEDPNQNKLYISQEDLGFGDYAVSNSATAPLSKSGRVLAGRQSGTSSSSLYVQLVTDTIYNNLDGQMQVPAIEVADTMMMDAIIGPIFYGFSNYRLLPRNNDDFVNINVTLDTTNLETSPISIIELEDVSYKIYPNPANDYVKIAASNNAEFEVIVSDLMGRTVMKRSAQNGNLYIDTDSLSNGTYVVNIITNGAISSTKIIVQH